MVTESSTNKALGALFLFLFLLLLLLLLLEAKVLTRTRRSSNDDRHSRLTWGGTIAGHLKGIGR